MVSISRACTEKKSIFIILLSVKMSFQGFWKDSNRKLKYLRLNRCYDFFGVLSFGEYAKRLAKIRTYEKVWTKKG